MPALIEQLIDKTDNIELVRDQIAAILLVESTEQQELAQDAGKNPKYWKLRVFLERANAWGEWIERPDPKSNEEGQDTSPIVNVWFDRAQVDKKSSDVVQKQQYDGTFNVDCYGYGVSTPTLQGGHDPGDMRAALEAQRAARLARNILMSSYYVWLGMKGIVADRMVETIQSFQPQIDDRPVQRVCGVRLALGVNFKELSPQIQGQPLELLSLEVRRAETGELFFEQQHEYVDS